MNKTRLTQLDLLYMNRGRFPRSIREYIEHLYRMPDEVSKQINLTQKESDEH